MKLTDEMRDPWGLLIAAVCGGAGWALLAQGHGFAAAVAGLGIFAAVLAAQVVVRAAVGPRPSPSPSPELDRLPPIPEGSIQGSLLARADFAIGRLAKLGRYAADPTVASELARVLPRADACGQELAGLGRRVTLLDQSIDAAAPQALADEISVTERAVGSTTHTDVRREQEAALASLRSKSASVERLERLREALIAQMRTSAVDLEGLATRAGELVAMGSNDLDPGQAEREVRELSQSLDSLQAGLAEARSVLRQL